MPEYLYPGVYVEEVDAGVTTVSGVSASGVEPLKRPSYFVGRLLDAATLSAEQEYHREKLRRLSRTGAGLRRGPGLGRAGSSPQVPAVAAASSSSSAMPSIRWGRSWRRRAATARA
jgi:hypothetical protein